MKDARVHAVGEVVGAAPWKPLCDALHDRLGLTADDGRVAVAEALQPHGNAMAEAARPHHPEPHGGFGPEIGNAEDHRRPRPPAEPEPGEPGEQGRALHDEIPAAPRQDGPQTTSGTPRAETVR